MKIRYMSLALLGATRMSGKAVRAQDNYSTACFCRLPRPVFPAMIRYSCRIRKASRTATSSPTSSKTSAAWSRPCCRPKKIKSGNHGYFYVQAASGVTIEIVSDLHQMNATKWPRAAVGDAMYVQGRYYYDNDDSQGIDSTHRGTSSSWPHAGCVVVNGAQ